MAPEQLRTRFEYDQLVIICITITSLLSTVIFIFSFFNIDQASVFVVPIAYFWTCIFYSNVLILRSFHRRLTRRLGPKALAHSPRTCPPLYSKTSVVSAWCVTALWLLSTPFTFWTISSAFMWNSVTIAPLLPQAILCGLNNIVTVIMATMIRKGRRQFLSQSSNASVSRGMSTDGGTNEKSNV